MNTGKNINDNNSRNSLSEFLLESSVEDRVLRDVLEKMPEQASSVAEKTIRNRIRMILSEYGSRNILYDLRSNVSPVIVRRALELTDGWVYTQNEDHSLFLVQDNLSITVLTYLTAIVSEKEEDKHPAGIEKSGITESDKEKCYDKIIDFIKRSVYVCPACIVAS